ncbi:MAG: hypothetical protein R3B48_25770 [Kofleriaceae bacterium]
MNTLLRTLLPMTLLASFANAAHADSPKAAPAAPPKAEAKPAPKAEAKPAPRPEAMPASKAEPAVDRARMKVPVRPPQPPPMPAAPKEVAAMARTQGNWRCTGVAMGPMGEQKLVASVRNRLDVDKWWVHTSFAEIGGGKYKFEAFTTFDARTNKWHRVMVDNMGGQELAVSDGPKDGITQWDAKSRSIIGEGMGRHHEDRSDPKVLKMWGEYSVDNGRTWMKAYEASCKR